MNLDPGETIRLRRRLWIAMQRLKHLGLIFSTIVVAALAGAPRIARAAKDIATPIAPWDRVENVRLGGFNRHFMVHVPPSFDPSVNTQSSSCCMARAVPASRRWSRPDGIARPTTRISSRCFPMGCRRIPSGRRASCGNPQTWNEGSGRHASGKRNDPDVEFIAYIIDTLETHYGADPNRIYVTGFSNGASMTFRVGDRAVGQGRRDRAGRGASVRSINT